MSISSFQSRKNDNKPKPAPEKKPTTTVNAETFALVEYSAASRQKLSKDDIIRLNQEEVQRVNEVFDSRIKPEDTYAFNKRVKIERAVGKGVVQAPPKYLPALIKDYFPVKEKKLNYKQQNYKKNVVTSEDLRRPTPDVVYSQNRSKLFRYILINELYRCRNALIYYLVPLILDIIFLFQNIGAYPFIENILFALGALIVVLTLNNISKDEDTSTALNVLKGFGVIVAFAFIMYAWNKYLPESSAKIHLPYALKLLFCIFVIYHFGKYYVIFGVMYSQDCSLDNHVVVTVYAGAPGCGKTSKAVQDASVIALKKWNELQYAFWNMHSREKDILKRNDVNELLLYHEVKTSYNFYIMHAGIPCLWANFEITDNLGRKNYEVTLEHLKGLKRLPLFAVVVYDELGAVLKTELGFKKGDVYDVSDMFRLGRQFLKWTFIGCEQDYNNIFIDCRRVVGENNVATGQEWICKPTLLLGVIDVLKFLVGDTLDKKVKRQRLLANVINPLEKFANSIGFRKNVYQRFGNVQTSASLNGSNINQELVTFGKQKIRYISSEVIYDYDDRDYRKAYASYYDREIDGKVYSGSYKQQLLKVSTTDLLEEKREAINDEIAKIA